MDKEKHTKLKQFMEDVIEQTLRCNYPHLSIQEIREMDESEKRLLMGWD